MLLVAVGGAIGAVARGLAEAAGPAIGVTAWVMVLMVNILGCFIIGLLLVWLECRLCRDGGSRLATHPGWRGLGNLPMPDPTLPAPEIARARRRLRLLSGLLMTGVLGGFTTFSTVALDVVTLAESGRLVEACLDVGLSVLGGVLAAIAGLELGIRHCRAARG
jgi:CrcB protein